MSSEMEIRVIENNKDRIARAVSMAVANGDKEMANALYPRFFNDMKNATIFFIGVSKFESSYEIKRKKIIKELSDFIGHDVKPYIDGECKVGKRVIVEDESKEFLEFYKKYARYYARYGIEYETLQKIYFADEIEQLDQKISKIQKYQWAREFKEYRIQKKEMKKLPIMGKEFDELRNKFKVTTIDELFLLGIEIDSFFVDVSDKTERQKNILERNKERFRQRIGASHDYVLDEKSAEKIKEKINRVYNFNLYRQLLDNSNLGEFKCYHKFTFDSFKCISDLFSS